MRIAKIVKSGVLKINDREGLKVFAGDAMAVDDERYNLLVAQGFVMETQAGTGREAKPASPAKESK